MKKEDFITTLKKELNRLSEDFAEQDSEQKTKTKTKTKNQIFIFRCPECSGTSVALTKFCAFCGCKMEWGE